MYVNKKYDKARNVLKSIARFNGVKVTPIEIDSIVFDTENEFELKTNSTDGLYSPK